MRAAIIRIPLKKSKKTARRKKAKEVWETRQSEFLKQWPDADIDSDGVINIRPCYLNRNHPYCIGVNCTNCRREFWRQEVKA